MLERLVMPQAKKGNGRFVRKNITLPATYEERMERLRVYLGAASDSEVIRQGIARLEELHHPALERLRERQEREEREHELKGAT